MPSVLNEVFSKLNIRWYRVGGLPLKLDTITKIIADTVPVETIYLFGSHAYGTPHKDSDLDLYVVLKVYAI